MLWQPIEWANAAVCHCYASSTPGWSSELTNSECLGTLCNSQGLIEIPEDIINVFDANCQPHIIICDAGCHLFLRAKLLVRRGGRMDRQ